LSRHRGKTALVGAEAEHDASLDAGGDGPLPSRPGFRFQLSTVEMLDVAGAFEAIVRSMVEGGSVSLRRT
jgi:hypothetical protein